MWFMTGDHVALLVNNLGSTSELEMNIVTLEAIKLLGSANDKHVCLEWIALTQVFHVYWLFKLFSKNNFFM